MAMPNLPPPERPPLVEQVVALAERMAASVGEGIGDVLRREKSRNWMLGQIRKLRPEGLDDEEVRECIAALSKVHRPTPPGEQPVKLTSRRPNAGNEPSEWPVWTERVERIGDLLVYPMDMPELLRRSVITFRWKRNFTICTVSAAEDHGELWWDGLFWQRTRERIIVTTKNQTVKRVVRNLPVELKDADRSELLRRLNDIEDEKKATAAELEEKKKTLTAQLRSLDAARERVIESMRTGRETQSVTCEERHNYASKTVTVIRKDTGAVVETREMNAAELQVPIPGTAATS